jgi:hypothetical protein
MEANHMNRLVFHTLLVLFSFVAGCDGGSNATYQQRVDLSGTGPDGPTDQVPPEPPQTALFDCNSVLPVPTSQVEAEMEGVWDGTLVDCTSGTSGDAKAFVTGDGRLRLLGMLHGEVLSTAVEIVGDTFAGEGRYFDPTGSWSTALRVDGLIRDGKPIIPSVERDRMEGLWITDAGAYGYFSLDHSAGQNHPPISLQRWPAEWDIWASPSDAAGEWIINPQGVVKGQDVHGCQYAGQFAAAEPKPFYELNLNITGCALKGTYSGIGDPHSGPFNDILDVTVDDGDQRSLVMLLGSK